MSHATDAHVYQLIRAHRAQVERLQEQRDAYRAVIERWRDTCVDWRAGKIDPTAPPDAARAARLMARRFLRDTDDLPGID